MNITKLSSIYKIWLFHIFIAIIVGQFQRRCLFLNWSMKKQEEYAMNQKTVWL
jgi:hypothetical protein